MSVELCACGHDYHPGRRCRLAAEKPGELAQCSCQATVRIDLATFRVLVDIAKMLDQINRTGVQTRAVVEMATGLQSRTVLSEDGGAHVEIQPMRQPAQIIIPGR